MKFAIVAALILAVLALVPTETEAVVTAEVRQELKNAIINLLNGKEIKESFTKLIKFITYQVLETMPDSRPLRDSPQLEEIIAKVVEGLEYVYPWVKEFIDSEEFKLYTQVYSCYPRCYSSIDLKS